MDYSFLIEYVCDFKVFLVTHVTSLVSQASQFTKLYFFNGELTRKDCLCLSL